MLAALLAAPARMVVTREAAMTVEAVADAPPAPPAPPAPVASEIAIAADIAVPVFATVDDAAAVTPVAGADGCGLTDTVTQALRASPAVRAVLGRIPLGSRSVANAVLVWNGQWAEPDSVGGAAALASIREVVVASVAAAPQACRNAAVVGPRLMLIAEPSQTLVLAMGSGVWAWGQLS